MRTVRILLGSLAVFVVVEFLVFHTRLYTLVLSPESSTGILELRLENETRRPVADRNQVLIIGDSRMGGFFPRYADQIRPALRYTFATIATPGTTPRCWYYMLRDVDPSARRYAAIVIGVNDYDDAETWDNHADYISDLHYLIARLRLRDLVEFSSSYHDPSLKWESARGILVRGLVYKTDFQDFLRNPLARIESASLARRESAGWYRDYAGTTDSVKDVRIDWTTRTLDTPPTFTPAQRSAFQGQFLDDRAPQTGRRSAYLKRWFGRIHDLYRNSGTRIIFVRLPRGPFVRPDPPPFNPHSSVRDLAAFPEVILDDEHYFDSLEHPELFMDTMHLNGPGSAEFSRMLMRHVQELLGPPHTTNAL
jgi:hypothetical protein